MHNDHPVKTKPYFLAVECSGRVGSVAMGSGPDLLEEITFSGKMRHSSELFPALNRILKSAGCTPRDVSTLCFTAGPGSFTGLRIAVTAAKMLNFAQKTRLIAVNTLDVIAENATEYVAKEGGNPSFISPILDAKQNHFFTAIYKKEEKGWHKETEDAMISSDQILSQTKDNTILLGEGLLYHADLFRSHGIRFLPPEYWPAKASKVLKIGYKMAQQSQFADPFSLVPFYIRQPDAIEKWDRKEMS